MTGTDGAETWAPGRERQIVTVARNLSTRYLAIIVETVIGLVMLPFNIAHLGPTQYGLWVLLGSISTHFSVLDLGYGGALVKYMAQYRAHRNAQALNEIASTLFFVFLAIGLVAYGAATLVAFNIGHLFRITPEQAETGKWMMMIIAVHFSLNFPFSIYGGVICGFQRYDANNLVAVVSTIAVAAANAAVLLAGYGLLQLVAATTAVRVITYFVYRANAYRIFPELRIGLSLFRRSRLRELTGFSVYSSVIDWANKLNYELDELIIGAFMGSAAVAVWAPAERIISGTQRITNQLNGLLFPVIVDSDATQQKERLQQIFLQGTLLSLVMVVPIAAALILLADPLVHAWLGPARAPAMVGAIPIIQILSVAVVIRVGDATGTTILKGAGQHRMLAGVNLGTGLANLALSILLLKPFGLIGVAVGTLIPIAFTAIVILYPASCRRVDLPVWYSLRQSVFPAIWPAFVVGGGLAFSRRLSSGTLLAVAAEAAIGGLLYLALFYTVALGRRDRALYTAKALELVGRGRFASAV
ncbi:MAG: oligosaccharide flippase family protein [Acidobacteriota bacterium]